MIPVEFGGFSVDLPCPDSSSSVKVVAHAPHCSSSVPYFPSLRSYWMTNAENEQAIFPQYSEDFVEYLCQVLRVSYGMGRENYVKALVFEHGQMLHVANEERGTHFVFLGKLSCELYLFLGDVQAN